MSYHPLGLHPSESPVPWTPTTAFAQAVDPYSFRFSPPGAVYAPYGWGPDFTVGMPANYTHHLDYVRTPTVVGPPGMVPIQTPQGYRYVKATPQTMAIRRAQERGRRLGTRPIGPMYDQLAPYSHGTYLGSYEEDYAGIFGGGGGVDTANYQSLGDRGDGLGGILAVL